MKKLFILSLIFLFSCSQKGQVDLILKNGHIITLNPESPTAELIAVKKDRIQFVGKNSDINNFDTAHAKIIDLNGKTLIPGFIDAHAHFLSLGNSLKNISLSKIKAWNDAVALVKQAVKKSRPGDWITGRGWHQEKWESVPKPNIKGFPTHNSISKISPDNPIILKHASGHAIFVNAKAMQIAGINSKTKSPAGGEIIKDTQGNPTGVLLETAMDLVYNPYQKHLESLNTDEQKRIKSAELQAAMQHSLENGVTTFSDAGSFFNEIDLFKEFAAQDKLDIRLWVMVSSEETLSDALLQKYKLIGFGDNHLTVRAIKQYADGALGSRGAWMLQPYSDMPSTSGFNVTLLDSIRKTAQFAYKNGYQLCTHSIGDRANREMLAIYQDVLNGDTTRRWRIEHAQHLSLDDISRFAPLGIIASMQTVHCTSDGPWVPTRIGAKRAEDGAYVWQKLLATGAHFANGTDCPVERLSPIENFYAAVTRRLPDSTQFYPKQILSREEALKSLTIWNAYAGFEEDIKGSIAVGKLADFVILSQNIITVPEEEILKTKILSTIVGGEVKYEDKE